MRRPNLKRVSGDTALAHDQLRHATSYLERGAAVLFTNHQDHRRSLMTPMQLILSAGYASRRRRPCVGGVFFYRTARSSTGIPRRCSPPPPPPPLHVPHPGPPPRPRPCNYDNTARETGGGRVSSCCSSSLGPAARSSLKYRTRPASSGGARACGVAEALRALRRERAPRLGGRRVRRDLEGSRAHGSPAVRWCCFVCVF